MFLDAESAVMSRNAKRVAIAGGANASHAAVNCLSAGPAPRAITACVLWATLVMLGVGCSKGIGDECDSALDCSVSASRLCDRSQPHGYCTLSGCRSGSCPDDAVCVTFWQNTDRSDLDRNRLSINYCMRKCEERSDCRDDEGYSCFSGSEFGQARDSNGEVIASGNEATVQEDPNQRFCAVVTPTSLKPAPPGDTGTDAGVIDIAAPDGG